MKKLLTLLLQMIPFFCFAQRSDWVDYAAVGNLSPLSNAVATDADGNIYSLHKYSGNIILQGDTIPAISGQEDCILVKYDSTGQLIWTKTFGGTWFDDVYKVAADASGHVYVSCMVQTTTVMSDTTYPCLTNYQVIQFDSDGNFLRCRFITGLGTAALAALGDYVYIAHENEVEKLDTSLITVWSRSAPAGTMTFYSTGDLYVTPGGRIIASGIEASGGTATFDTISINFTTPGFDEVFVISMDTSGNAFWGRAIYPASSSQESTFGAAGDEAGNVYMTTRTTSQMIFGNDTLENPFGASQAYNAIVRYNSSGQEVWARALYPQSSADFFDVLVNSQGEILIAGSYVNGSATFGQFSLPASGGAIVLKMDSAGTALWEKHDVQTMAYTKHFKGLANLDNGYAAAGFFPNNFQLECFEAGNSNIGFFTTWITENPILNTSFTYSIVTPFTFSFTDQSTGALSWHWDFGDGDTSDQANPVHTYASTGSFTVMLITSNGVCTDTASVQIINVGLPDYTEIPEIRIYPNPGNMNLYVDMNKAERVTILSMQGKVVIQQEDCTEMPLHFNTKELSQGMYLVRVETRGYMLTRKWIKMN